MDWSDLPIFLEVARAQQLGRAAASLGVDATTVGRRLRRLETAVGQRLFEQGPDGQILTSAGEDLLARATAMAAIASDIRTPPAGRTEVDGTIRVSVAEGFGTWFVSRHLGTLAQAHPKLAVDLVATSGFLNPTRRETDVAVLLARPRRGPLRTRKLTDYTLRLYASAEHLAAHGPVHGIADLRDRRMIGYVPDIVYAPELRYLDEIPGVRDPVLRSSSINAQAHMIASGAGIGKVGPFEEQGNWYTGGVPRTLFHVWLYGVDNPLRAELPHGLDQPTRARIARYNDLDAKKPEVNWPTQIKHLPYADLLKDLGEPPATFEQFTARKGPADPAWRSGGLYHDDKGWGVPALWFNSWYDVSIGPNMALFNHARAVKSDAEASANQYVVVAPNTHCAFARLGPNFTSGDRDLGDASFDVDGQVYAFFDRWLKGDRQSFPATTPAVRYYNMGANRWNKATQWPPAGATVMRLYLRSGGRANGRAGDGRLDAAAPPASETADRFTYDPANPVQTIGGGDCCNGGLVTAGAFDQRVIEARDDVLVYTSDALTQPTDVTGFVQAVLKVSSDALDTDFAVKLVDVAPDGTAYILGDTILRARYRDGFARPTMMANGQVYTLKPTPITTSNTFLPGHRIRVEVTSSNFPKFVRNLNTGGDNERETRMVVAHNQVHHAGDAASYIDLPVVRR